MCRSCGGRPNSSRCSSAKSSSIFRVLTWSCSNATRSAAGTSVTAIAKRARYVSSFGLPVL